jgi:hypothetical protein
VKVKIEGARLAKYIIIKPLNFIKSVLSDGSPVVELNPNNVKGY